MAAVAPASDGQPPNNTVYIRNLEERIKIPALTEALRELFEEYGTIIDIVAKRNIRARGQAFVVYEDAASAQRAIEEVNGFDLFDKPMKLDFARTKSDATVKVTASEEEFDQHKRHRVAERERKEAQEQQANKLKRAAPADGVLPIGEPVSKLAKGPGAGLKSTAPGKATVVADEYLPPNKILFLQNLPEDYDVEGLSAIFGRFEGFKEVRLVPGRSGIAFVEYEAETGAISAKESTANMTLGDEGKQIKVTFQRQ